MNGSILNIIKIFSTFAATALISGRNAMNSYQSSAYQAILSGNNWFHVQGYKKSCMYTRVYCYTMMNLVVQIQTLSEKKKISYFSNRPRISRAKVCIHVLVIFYDFCVIKCMLIMRINMPNNCCQIVLRNCSCIICCTDMDDSKQC